MDAFTSYLFDKESWLAYILLPSIAIVIGLFVAWSSSAILGWYNKKRPSVLKEQLLQGFKKPLYFFIPFLFLRPLISYFELGTFWEKVLEGCIIICLAWLFIALLYAVVDVVKQKFSIEVGSYHKASERKALTQLRFLKSIGLVIILTIAGASILWNFPGARQLGNTILTSAGVLGIIIGVAAQKSIANLIVGFQLAFTQALKIDDEVDIEGEFGSVEDITLTYVVIKTWDWRRLVLPLNYFNEKPYINWTFNSRPVIASVFFYVDYTFPVQDLRDKFKEILNDEPFWDKHIADLEVTDTDDRTMKIRASFSVRNATHAWKLRCKVREDLVAFIQKKYPDALPKLRRMDAEEV